MIDFFKKIGWNIVLNESNLNHSGAECMIKSVYKGASYFLLLVGAGAAAQAASFDCSKASTETEKAICADPELSAVDDLMGSWWGTGNKPSQNGKTNSLIEDQLAWVNDRNNCSNDTSCIRNQYKSRFNELEMSLVAIFDQVREQPVYFLETKFWHAYNSSSSLYRSGENGAQLEVPNIFIPDTYFLEDINSCNISSLTASIATEETPFIDIASVWINDFGVNEGVNSHVKWAGHGDQSHSIFYQLVDGIFLPKEIFFDNCSDGEIFQVEVIFESE